MTFILLPDTVALCLNMLLLGCLAEKRGERPTLGTHVSDIAERADISLLSVCDMLAFPLFMFTWGILLFIFQHLVDVSTSSFSFLSLMFFSVFSCLPSLSSLLPFQLKHCKEHCKRTLNGIQFLPSPCLQ